MGKRPSFQFYPGDWLKDPALRSVSIGARGLWIDMLCVAWESPRKGYLVHRTGRPITPEQLARTVGCSVDETAKMLQELEDCGVCSRTADGILYSRRIDRDERNRELAADRVKRFRARSRDGPCNAGCNGDVTVDVTPLLQRSSTSATASCDATASPLSPKGNCADGPSTSENHERKSSSKRREGAAVTEMQAVLDAWNMTPGIRQAKFLNDKRRKALSARFADQHWRENWISALDRVSASDFCRGKNGRNWLATFDFFIKPDTVLRLMEGEFDGRKGVDFSGLEEFLSDDKA